MEASGLEMCIAAKLDHVEVDVGPGGANFGPLWLVHVQVTVSHEHHEALDNV
jgi:hypothetical protein|tara:strand:+ start:12312 stop:12467 length:156 start_codon:yes stop_codon:yes gene_type:complete